MLLRLLRIYSAILTQNTSNIKVGLYVLLTYVRKSIVKENRRAYKIQIWKWDSTDSFHVGKLPHCAWGEAHTIGGNLLSSEQLCNWSGCMYDRKGSCQGCSVMPSADEWIQGRIQDCAANLLEELVRSTSRSESFTMQLDKITMLFISQFCLFLWGWLCVWQAVPWPVSMKFSHTEVCWPSRGKVLLKMFQLRMELQLCVFFFV